MQSQPGTNEYDINIGKIQDKIKLLKTGSVNENTNEVKKWKRSTALCTEYQKIIQLRSDERVSLKAQWEQYQNEQKQYRQKDIDKRQVDFDKELSLLDAVRRRKWKVEEETLTNERKKEIYQELLSKLKNSITSDEETTGEHTLDALIITLPVDLLEHFWLLDIEVPITETELLQTINLIQEHLTKLK